MARQGVCGGGDRERVELQFIILYYMHLYNIIIYQSAYCHILRFNIVYILSWYRHRHYRRVDVTAINGHL